MKFNGACFWALAFSALLPVSYPSANTFIVGGYVPEQRNVTVTPTLVPAPVEPDKVVEVAMIEIDNNLPNYALVLDFTDRFGGNDLISEVRLKGEGGTLGQGLAVPVETVLTPESGSGQFTWNPGTQESATFRYRVRVLVTYKRPMAEQPLMTVSMPSFF
jgi:hypothetical protein